MWGWFSRAPALESYTNGVNRDVLIQAGRILFVDDELIPLIDELKAAGFAVNHDVTGHEYEQQVVNQVFDVAVIDYSGVGKKYGPKQGLDLMRFIRRVSPRTRVIAYTSKGLGSDKSDFYRLADTVLAKDAGVTEALESIEAQLQKAFSKQHLFDALLKGLDVSSGKDRIAVKEAVEKALKAKDQSGLKTQLKKVVGAAADKGIDLILAKLFLE
jgi:DNA-binding NarL/FixJ family response regulator